jgi:hypothetical protein
VPLSAKLIETTWPDYGPAHRPPAFPLAELEARLARMRAAMRSRGLTQLALYADREHFASLYWLTGFDPRFEEALLILPLDADPLILVGNECETYLKISPLFTAGQLRHERYQPFSLPDQPMDDSRPLGEILAAEHLGRTGIADWKPGRFAAPHWIVEAIASAAASIEPATDLVHRTRACCSAAEIAYFEWTNTLASDGVRRILEGLRDEGLRDGVADHELMTLARYNGEPVGCHWTMKCGDHRTSLASPRGSRVERGGPFSTNVCYWGANVCRAGWVAASESELPEPSRGYTTDFAGPYFAACAEWLEQLRPGASAGELFELVHARLPFDRFGVFLNPGHLIHYDEWLAAPFYRGSAETLASGMVIQSDIIPHAPRYFSTRMEDGFALADAALRSELADRFPAVLARCEARRQFLAGTLGIHLDPSVLPLSNLAGLVSPFFLNLPRVFAIQR